MFQIRKSQERGQSHFHWLKSAHSFSFGEYHDAKHMGFSDLRVINEDIVAAGEGFGTHGHRDMEIITYVLEGALEHKDSLGHSTVIRPGEVQKMSAGKGILHSEFNHSHIEPVHFLQLWILPNKHGISPYYAQEKISPEPNKLVKIVAPSGTSEIKSGIVPIEQDASIYACHLEKGSSIKHELLPSRHYWLQLARGGLMLNGELISQGDGVAISDENALELATNSNAEFLFFDLN